MRAKSIVRIVIVLGCISQGRAQKRGFDVRDAIEMTTFSEPNANEPLSTAKLSPNQRYFLVETSHGVIQSDRVESRLWLFNVAETQEFLRGDAVPSKIPRPKPIAEISAVPTIDSYSPNSPVISDVRWTPDSQAIYFLGQNSLGRRQLHIADVRGGPVRTLTSPDYDVERYNFMKGVLVYTATRSQSAAERNLQMQRGGAVPITGKFITSILFPQKEAQPTIHELWSIRNGRARQVVRSSSLSPDLLHYWDVLSISPDGRSVVQINPVHDVPSSWEDYIPEIGKEDWQIDHENPKTTFPSNLFRARQYVLTDLDSGRSKPLIEAPYADVLAYIESFQAVWSPTGRRLLLTNTFLPLDHVDAVERMRRLHPCAVASINIASGETQCIVFTRSSPETASDKTENVNLETANFGVSENEVVLELRAPHDPSIKIERYRYSDGVWRLVQQASESVGHANSTGNSVRTADTLRITVKQSLNDPPVLWATDTAAGKGREIWNPNPQFANLEFGVASVFRWKDKTGFEWTGGLVKPVGYIPGKRYPLVIQTHGFADYAFMTDGLFPTAMAARPLASEGIAVLQVLGNAQHVGMASEAADNVLGYESAVDQLTSDGLVDPKRVGIVGFSRTSWHVESALIGKPDLFAAASINDGIDQSYMQSMLFDPDRISEGEEIYKAKPFGEGLQVWVKSAPSFHLDKVHTPVMITAIKPASVLQEWEIYSSLYRQKKPVDFIYIPNGQHILQSPRDRLASQQGNVDWFRFWLQGYERPNPEDPDQYKRWEHLRELRDADTKTTGQSPANPSKPN